MLYAVIVLSILISALICAVIFLAIKVSGSKPAEIDMSALNNSFMAASMNALTKQNELGGQELTNKKQLIDQRLEAVNAELAKVTKSIQEFSGKSGEKMEGVSSRLDSAAQVIAELRNTTGRLNEMLGSGQKRGEWGQRMAKDILDMAGLRETINYTQQESSEAGRPDYTFILPNGLKVNMDCKFPLSNYKNYIEAKSQAEKEMHLKKFISDARGRLKETGKKDYIDPDNGTLDYAIMFISNEQVFNFINESDPLFIDDALKMKVVVCSPFTLYAFVSVARQASENFKMEKASREILGQLGKFAKQWEEFKGQFDAVERAIDSVKTEFDRLVTTRSRMLEVPMKAVERIREEEGIKAEDN